MPLDTKTHWVQQRTLNQLLEAIAGRSSAEYAMIVKNGLNSDVNPKDSLAALKQVKVERDAAGQAQLDRANAILTTLHPLIDYENPSVTRTVLSYVLK